MWARTQLKIGWRDLLAGVRHGLFPADREKASRQVESYWSDGGGTMAAYSVRSGFHLLLTALGLQPGDEILFSALNVRGMVRIVAWHDLVAVPIDLEIAHMGPSLDRLRRAITPRSKVLVVAHLFGTHLELDPIFTLAREHGLLVVEDCAQAFAGRRYPGHPKADVCMFSFGPLKTATALGGALIKVRDPALLERMRAIQAGWPVQPEKAQLKRVAQFAGLKIITSRPVMGLIYRFFHARGRDYEDAVSERVRNVANLKKRKFLEYQPSYGMLALMDRRIRTFREEVLQERTDRGERLRRYIGDAVVMPGRANSYCDYWVFPILVDDPRTFIEELRAEGFDGANLPRSQAVPAPADRPELEPRIAAQALSDLIVLPCYPGMSDAELKRQADVVRRIAAKVGTARTSAYRDAVPQ
ncbi:aminotransferase class V-fold PLP-dependent enzyme [Rhodoligotrophos defluvii]|uniref:aminotransferase class V-fold PLP-dependent enzyme n=1 Tax=Rhodoligotrophos defluvii TaxID=2561934 RepID=UPI0010C9DDF8|nr:aminotransferase class V-fold PLP-dependent enzyme [Rhodoligotrophos defluvii]